MELMIGLASYYYICWGARFSSNQSLTALLTTALIIGLYDYLKEKIPTLDGFLEITITPLHVLLIMECSTRFLLRRLIYSTQLNYKIRSWT